MQRKGSTVLTALVAAGVILSGLFVGNAAGWLPVTTAGAQASVQELPRTITVVGEGKVRIKPDVARANIGVEVVKPTVEEASAENKAVIEAVLGALQEQGVAENDIQTSNFSIYAERYGSSGPLPEDEVQYRVSNNVTVVIRDLESVGTVLDAAVQAGANNIYGVEFSLEDASQVESEARAEAVTDAQRKAAELAELNGVELGQVIQVSEVIGGNGGFYTGMLNQMGMPQYGGGGGAPISPGELELRMQLQVVYGMAE